jgi:hypothetical protein
MLVEPTVFMIAETCHKSRSEGFRLYSQYASSRSRSCISASMSAGRGATASWPRHRGGWTTQPCVAIRALLLATGQKRRPRTAPARACPRRRLDARVDARESLSLSMRHGPAGAQCRWARHRSDVQRPWLRSLQRDWLVVEHLPPYAPDLNPVEGLWANLKAVDLAGLSVATLDERRPSSTAASIASVPPGTCRTRSCVTAGFPYDRASTSSANLCRYAQALPCQRHGGLRDEQANGRSCIPSARAGQRCEPPATSR